MSEPVWVPLGAAPVTVTARDMCRVRHATNQAITHGGERVVYFNYEDFDTNNMHDTVTNNDRITIRTAGKYALGAALGYQGHSAGARGCGLRRNGADYLAYTFHATSLTTDTMVEVTTIFDLAVNDYLQVLAFQDSGGTLNVTYAPYYSPVFWAHRID